MKVKEVFEMAIHLMDEQNEATGAAQCADTREYALRTPSILNSVLDRLYPYSDTYPGLDEGGRRPVCPKAAGMEDTLALDEGLCAGVLSFYLAYMLALSDGAESAAHFRALYDTAVYHAARRAAADCGTVADVYGGVEFSEFGRWP